MFHPLNVIEINILRSDFIFVKRSIKIKFRSGLTIEQYLKIRRES